MWAWSNDLAWWQAGLVWVSIVGFWGVVIWLVYMLSTTGRSAAGDGESEAGSAVHILDQRLARGEIDLEEYRRLREVLQDGPGPAASR